MNNPSFLVASDAATSWRADFAAPPAEFRPVPFWSWNERMEPREIRRQVALMKEAGWGGAFIHSRIGLLTPYLGEEWFRACDAVMEACREHEMLVWLYDEDKWPSGYSGGSVPLADADYRFKTLIARPVGAPIPESCAALGAPVNGLQCHVWTSPLGDAWFNGTCYADLMNRQAMRKFLDDAYESYYQRYGALYGDLIRAEFTDEPTTAQRSRLPVGSVPFTGELPAKFAQMWGYDPLSKLHLLFEEAPGCETFRLHYFRVTNELFERNFSQQLGDWCDDHNIALTGHYILEGDLYHQQLWGSKLMPNYRHQGIPGIDHLGRQIEERITAKQCQSVANQYGKRRMLSELYGVAGGALSFQDRFWIASEQIVLGVNLLNPHLSLYTMAGCRKRDYPQNIFYQQPWWPLNRTVDDPLSRLCVALAQGKYRAEALVIHPQESAFALWESRARLGGDDQTRIGSDWSPVTDETQAKIGALDREFDELTNALLGAQRTFDFGDETILADDGQVVTRDGAAWLRIGEMDYPAVILPSIYNLAPATLDLLEEFQNAGGLIVRSGRAPQWLDGAPSQRLEHWLESVPLLGAAAVPARLGAPAVEAVGLGAADAELLWVHIRDLEDGERLVFLTNLSRTRDFSTRVKFGGAWGEALELDIARGDQTRAHAQLVAGGLEVELDFARAQGHLLRLKPGAPQLNGSFNGAAPGAPAAVLEEVALDWTVERMDDNAFTLDYAHWKTDGDWSERAAPVIALQNHLNANFYRGPLSLRYEVRVADLARSRRVHLVVEHPERYQIKVNGNQVQYDGLPFWRDIRWLPLDISGRLRAGDNEIELRCADFQPGDLASIVDQDARYGTEIESVTLVGDFAVSGTPTPEKPKQAAWEAWGLPPVGVQCFAPDAFVVGEPLPLRAGDVTTQGLPFYAGRLALKTRLPAALKSARRALVQLQDLDAPVAQVMVDGRELGTLWTHPLEIELDAQALQGEELQLTLYGTLRNLLGPHHNAEGELAQVGPDHFWPHFPGADAQTAFVQWSEGEISAPDWDDRYCMVTFGDVGASLRIAAKN